ncbi:hypothetical protein FIV00_14895 [Labrenzia sp. THAF82]|uniref:hypothetical protein n=1 Tax=Labrenzia sp. THAF82 TaxID=2587861 RepID=UPI00126794A1|nr:hypothetical protein [Labrenzia sp. THAF82]QFT31777.1 hypothetical protein FIV00_14895 [Labrenzia sp. THAF82]
MARRWKPGDKITPGVLNDCLDTMAKIINLPGGEKYVPMYQRLERELQALEERQDALTRIRARARGLEQHAS